MPLDEQQQLTLGRVAALLQTAKLEAMVTVQLAPEDVDLLRRAAGNSGAAPPTIRTHSGTIWLLDVSVLVLYAELNAHEADAALGLAERIAKQVQNGNLIQ